MHTLCNLPQGPLLCLSVDSIAWRSGARRPESSGSEAGSAVEASAQAAQALAWLPISIRGMRVVLARPPAGGSGKQQGSKRRSQPNPAARAAARPAISTVLAVARKLLPGLPVTVQDVCVELQVGGWAGAWLCVREPANNGRTDPPPPVGPLAPRTPP
jgi:hypothetical protein